MGPAETTSPASGKGLAASRGCVAGLRAMDAAAGSGMAWSARARAEAARANAARASSRNAGRAASDLGGAGDRGREQAGERLSPDITEALAVLDAHRLVQTGLRRCQERVRSLTQDGAVSGGDSGDDRTLDRTLRDRRLLGEMRGELHGALGRLRERIRRSALEDLIGQVPLATLQHDVLLDRLCGVSWPRIAASRTRGDRGTAVRAFRQAVARVRATAAVVEVLGSTNLPDARDVAERTGLTVRMVNRIRRQLDRHVQMRREADGVGESQSPWPWSQAVPVPRRGQVAFLPRDPNRPNPGGRAEPCRTDDAAAAFEPAAWRVLQVRPGAELQVKVAIERLLAEEVRCRTLRTRPGRSGVAGYLALACRRPDIADRALAGLPGVVGWVGEGPGPDGAPGWESLPASLARGGAADVAAWLDPRGVRS